METVILPHLEQHPLHILLFKDVKNATYLRQQLLDGNQDFEYAFLDAAVLLSRDHVLAACFRAINDQMNGRLKSRNVHSEIVFSLSPNNNITESFRRFGLSDGTTNILAIKVGGDAQQIEAHLTQAVQGEVVPFTDEVLIGTRDSGRIRKSYKVDAKAQEAHAFVLGSMALKGS